MKSNNLQLISFFLVFFFQSVCFAQPQHHVIIGEGSSMISQLMAVVTNQFTIVTNGAVLAVYNASSSASAIANLASINSSTLYACTEIPPNQAELNYFNANNPIFTFPLALGAAVIIFNIPGVSHLNLTADSLAQIYQRNITMWNDPILVANNPGLGSISQPIFPYARNTRSGTTLSLSRYLSQSAPSWYLGETDLPVWPSGVLFGNSTASIASYVLMTNYSIGFTTLESAAVFALKSASVQNVNGEFIQPDISKIQTFANSISILPRPNESWENISFINVNQTGLYPMITISFILVEKNQTQNGILGAALSWLVKFIFSEYFQSQLNELNFIRFPNFAVEEANDFVDIIAVDPNYINYNFDDTCFSDLAIPVDSVRLCQGGVGDFVASSEYFIATFPPRTEPGCTSSVMLSTVIHSNYRHTQNETASLSAEFFLLNENIEYGLSNNNSAVVIQIQGNGMYVEWRSPMPTFTLCLSLNTSIVQDDKLDLWDFGTVLIDDDDSYNWNDVQFVFPMNLSVSQQTINDVAYLCGSITPPAHQNMVYFPIRTISDWQTAQYQLLDSVALSLCHTLAFIFLLTSLFCLVRMFLLGKYRLELLQIISVVLAFLFSVLRCLYFFLLPETISSPIADYILAVLPSFIYFSAFSIVISVWGVIAMADTVARRNKVTQYVDRVFIVLNIILYAIFIILVVGYSETAAQPVDIEVCGHILQTFDEESSAQYIISLFYGFLLGVISVGMSLAFVIFGWRISRQLKLSKSKRKLLYLAALISLSFFLHAIFIVVCVLLYKQPNQWFSFFGILITEIIPTAGYIGTTFKMDKAGSSNTPDKRKNSKQDNYSASLQLSKRETSPLESGELGGPVTRSSSANAVSTSSLLPGMNQTTITSTSLSHSARNEEETVSTYSENSGHLDLNREVKVSTTTNPNSTTEQSVVSHSRTTSPTPISIPEENETTEPEKV